MTDEQSQLLETVAEKMLVASSKELPQCGDAGSEIFKIFAKSSYDDIEELNDRLAKPAIDKGQVFIADLTAKVTVKMKDEGFRAKTVIAGSEYFFAGMYMTAGNKFIVQMSPVDDQPWEWVELGVLQADKLFPELGAAFLEAHGIKSDKENLIECILEAVKLEKSGEKEEIKKLAEDPSFGMF